MARVLVEDGPAQGLQLYITTAEAVHIGRDRKIVGCLHDSSISRKHGYFCLASSGSTLEFHDESRNGTWWVPAGGTEPEDTLKESHKVLAVGDALLLGHTRLRVVSVPVASSSAGSTTSSAAEPGDASAGPRRVAKVRRSSLIRTDDDTARRVYAHPMSQMLRRGSTGRSLLQAAMGGQPTAAGNPAHAGAAAPTVSAGR